MTKYLVIVAFVALAGACSFDVEPESGDNKAEQIGRIQQPGLVHGSLGMHCEGDYEHDWAAARVYGWNICNGLWNNLDATRQFRYNLHGKQYYWHSGGDGASNSLETVDMFFSVTHGGAYDDTYAAWAMWNDDANYGPPMGIVAMSNNIYLGNESHKLSIFATHACDILKFDSHFWNRWESVFSGLRMALGSHDHVNTGYAERHFGEDLAEYLNDGRTFKQAWGYAADSTTYNNQDVAMATVGTSPSNCTSRRDNMKWTNYSDYGRTTNDDWCGWYWDNI